MSAYDILILLSALVIFSYLFYLFAKRTRSVPVHELHGLSGSAPAQPSFHRRVFEHTTAMRLLIATLLLLGLAPARAAVTEVLHLTFDNGIVGPTWIVAGDQPDFVANGAGLCLRMKSNDLQSQTVLTPPYAPMVFIPVPGGYQSATAYRLQISGATDPLPGGFPRSYAYLGFWDSGLGQPYMLGTYAQFEAGWETPALPWQESGFSPGAMTFGVFLQPSMDAGWTCTQTRLLFDELVVQSKPLGASAEGIQFMLDGPYLTATSRMRDDLRLLNLIPLTEPYTAAGLPQVAGGGGETTTLARLNTVFAGTHHAVDWVRLELRSATTPTQLVATRQAVLWSNGSVRAANADDDLIFQVPAGTYHVVVRHRNHLPVMTASPVFLASNIATPTNLNFTLSSTPTYGTNARRAIGSVMALWCGDATANMETKYTGSGNDRDPILTAIGGTVPTATLTGQYRAEDVNLDGVVKYTGTENDRDLVLQTIGGSVPTAVRTAQVP